MEDSRLLFKYPCGCVGIGKPHAPRKDKNKLIWDDVLVVKICDPTSYSFGEEPDYGWLIPAPRLLTGSAISPEYPVPMTEMEEEDYFDFLRTLTKKAYNWKQAERMIRTVMGVANG